MFSPALDRGGFVEIRWLTGCQLWFTLDRHGVDQAAKAIERNRVNACWGLGIRGRVGGGRSDDIVGATSIWVDQDHDLTGWRDFPLRPSAVVNSGHGVHIYWFLGDVVSVQDFIMLREATTLAMSGDAQASKDAARVARAVGAINNNPAKGPPVPVTVEYLSEDRYTLDDLRIAASTAVGGSGPSIRARSFQRSRPVLRRNDRAPTWLARVYDTICDHLAANGHILRPTAHGGAITTCPLHEDHGPSLSLHPEKGWYCFAGCGSGRLTALAHRLGILV